MLFTWPCTIPSQSQRVNKCIHAYVAESLTVEVRKKSVSDLVFKLELDLLLKDTIEIKKKKYLI